MWAGALTGRPTVLFNAQIAFSGLQKRLYFAIHHDNALLVADFNHSDRLVRAVVEASFAADARHRVDHDLAADSLAMNRSGQTANHADRIGAMHASVGNHDC